jgi:hypothetical protein
MQTKITTRRAVLAGAATAVASTGIVPAKAMESDPIFAAIERHKEAFRLSQVARRIRSNTGDAGEADNAACNVATVAANALTTIRPATMAGLLALIHHVEAFNAGAFFLEPDPRWPEESGPEWQSAPMHWPESEDEDEIDLFGFAVLANVRRSLEAMAARAAQ